MNTRRRHESFPPGSALPPAVQLLQWMQRPFAMLDQRKAQYGDPFHIRLQFAPWGPKFCLVMLSDPHSIKAIFTGPTQKLSAAQGNAILAPFLGKFSLLLLDGETHLRHRRLLLPPFHGERMRAYGSLIRDITEASIESWPLGSPFRALSATQDISMDVILRAVFGVDEGPQHTQLKEVLIGMLESVGGPFLFIEALRKDWGPWSPGGRLQRGKELVRSLLAELIAERRAEFSVAPESPRADILSMLLRARNEDDQPLSDDELHDELLTLLLAGHETTAASLAWALYWIHRTPGVQRKLQAELDSLDSLDPDALARLPYLEGVCKETLRLYPIVPICVRMAQETVELGGFTYPRGTYLAPCIYLAHQREETFPQPHLFRPERFIDQKYSPYEYLPFGGGVRRCIGMAFALYEMKIALATIMARCELSLPTGPALTAVRRNVTLAPKDGTQMLFHRRRF